MAYQLSSGKQRDMEGRGCSGSDLAAAMYTLVETGEPDDRVIHFEMEDEQEDAFINPEALDYIVMPTYRYHEGCNEWMEEAEADSKKGRIVARRTRPARATPTQSVDDLVIRRMLKRETAEVSNG